MTLPLPDGGYNKGFFGYIGSDASVKNAKFSGNVVANAWSGTLAATNSGLVKNVIVDIKIYAYGGNSGALFAHNHGVVENVIVLGEAVSDDGHGNMGLLATNTGTLTNVFADISTVKAENFLAVGKVKDTEGLYFKSHEEMLLANTFANFDTNIWHIVDGEYPSLINE